MHDSIIVNTDNIITYNGEIHELQTVTFNMSINELLKMLFD